MRRRLYTDARIHELIGQAIPQANVLAAQHWMTSRKPTTLPTGQSLNALYQLAQIRKVRGKPFFAHRTWEEYIKHQHHVESFGNEHMPDERIHHYIKLLVDQGASVRTKNWTDSSLPTLLPTKISRKALYTIAYRRKVSGKSFFGYKTWKEYIAALRNNFGYKSWDAFLDASLLKQKKGK